ncbi:general secretion pathway protein D, partial [mine drainage metagenome]
MIPVKNVSAAELVPILRPMIPEWGHLAAYPPSNILIISDRASNVHRMMRIIHRIDTVGDQGVDVMPLQNASADQVVNVINQLYQGQAAAQMGRTFKVVADQRTNSALISGDPAERLRIRALVAELDTPSSAGGDTVLEGTTLCVGTTSAGGLSVAAMLRALRGNADLDTGGLNPNPTLLPSITRFFGPSDSRSITGALLGARPGAVRALRVAPHRLIPATV